MGTYSQQYGVYMGVLHEVLSLPVAADNYIPVCMVMYKAYPIYLTDSELLFVFLVYLSLNPYYMYIQIHIDTCT